MPDHDDWPWREIPERICRILWDAGLEDVQEVALLEDEDLLEVKGIGPARLTEIRQVFPGPDHVTADGAPMIRSPAGGMIRYGGQPGNAGGTGRPPNTLRRRFRDILELAQDEQVRRLEEMRNQGVTQMSDNELRLLLDVAGKYGIGTRHVLGLDWEQLAELMRDLGGIVRMHVLDASITSREEILSRIENDWREYVQSEPG